MPNIKQQKKRVRTSADDRGENLRYRSTVKTVTRRLEAAVDAGDKDRVAATRERGEREEQERKNRPPEKVKKVVADPASATLPTMDIEKPAAPAERKQKKVAQAPRQRDALDNLLDDQGVKPNNPSGGSSGLDSVLASGDKGSAKGKKTERKGRRGRN